MVAGEARVRKDIDGCGSAVGVCGCLLLWSSVVEACCCAKRILVSGWSMEGHKVKQAGESHVAP